MKTHVNNTDDRNSLYLQHVDDLKNTIFREVVPTEDANYAECKGRYCDGSKRLLNGQSMGAKNDENEADNASDIKAVEDPINTIL